MSNNFVLLGQDLVVKPEEITHYCKYVHEPDEDPDRKRFLGNLLGSPGHNTQISFKNGAVVWTSMTVERITELLSAGIRDG